MDKADERVHEQAALLTGTKGWLRRKAAKPDPYWPTSTWDSSSRPARWGAAVSPDKCDGRNVRPRRCRGNADQDIAEQVKVARLAGATKLADLPDKSGLAPDLVAIKNKLENAISRATMDWGRSIL